MAELEEPVKGTKEDRETKKIPVVQGVQGHLLQSCILEREDWW